MKLTDILNKVALKHAVGRSNIAYDADGLGSFLRGYLKNAIPFNNGGRPIKVDGIIPNYKNIKSQCAYALAKAINNNEIKISCDINLK